MNSKSISIIVAVDKNGLIGKGDSLPWSFSEDLKKKKKKTMGKFVIMGERTYKSIGKPLPGRKIIVLSKNNKIKSKEVLFASSIEEALSKAKGEVMIAGGASVYKQFLDIADKIYLTIIKGEFEGDIYFPKFNKDNWIITEENSDDLLKFQVLERKT